MKKLFHNSSFSLLLTILLVIFSTLLNTKVRLGNIANSISDSFYTSYTAQPAIADSLQQLTDAAEQLSLLSKDIRPSDSAEAAETVDSLRSILRYKTALPDTIYSSYSTLLSNCFAMESALVQAELNDEQKTVLASAMRQAAEAKSAIDNTSYNNDVLAFLMRYDRFPTSFLAHLAGVSYPVSFS